MGTALLKDLGLQLREDTEGFSSQNGVAWILSTRETQSGSAAITPWQVPLRLGGQSSTWGTGRLDHKARGKGWEGWRGGAWWAGINLWAGQFRPLLPLPGGSMGARLPAPGEG